MRSQSRKLAAKIAGACLAFVGGWLCGGCSPETSRRPVILASTTSPYHAGLLDELIGHFQHRSGWPVRTVAVGSGEALEMGEHGEADVVISHAQELEKKLVAAGHVVWRRAFMQNAFLVLGPSDDPAGVRKAETAPEALRKIFQRRARFVSRGDRSGTHERELFLWAQAGVLDGGKSPSLEQHPWYLEAGAGMAEALEIASQGSAYTLSDRSTYLRQRTHLALEVLHEGSPELQNVYAVLLVNPEGKLRMNREGGAELANFLVSAEAAQIIGEFGKELYGEPLFVPLR